ncbi:hypothetical protein NA56DRAFT_167935 [Hyaloscypha hepaticicola]|uniref:Uncharacterized protein n=1 Tax=Hyaloscypha hepaticicola TaxID=2082293 RepID=A0A2J6Q2M9_9HELO|nr:hypothetical protein NA56DRAFT_167935 [Hyaloscypha hepaticicola]
MWCNRLALSIPAFPRQTISLRRIANASIRVFPFCIPELKPTLSKTLELLFEPQSKSLPIPHIASFPKYQ